MRFRFVEEHRNHFPANRLCSVVDQSEEARAVEFLREVLAKGPMPSAELFIRAADAEISRPTLNRAKREAGVKSEKKGKTWIWKLAES